MNSLIASIAVVLSNRWRWPSITLRNSFLPFSSNFWQFIRINCLIFNMHEKSSSSQLIQWNHHGFAGKILKPRVCVCVLPDFMIFSLGFYRDFHWHIWYNSDGTTQTRTRTHTMNEVSTIKYYYTIPHVHIVCDDKLFSEWMNIERFIAIAYSVCVCVCGSQSKFQSDEQLLWNTYNSYQQDKKQCLVANKSPFCVQSHKIRRLRYTNKRPTNNSNRNHGWYSANREHFLVCSEFDRWVTKTKKQKRSWKLCDFHAVHCCCCCCLNNCVIRFLFILVLHIQSKMENWMLLTDFFLCLSFGWQFFFVYVGYARIFLAVVAFWFMQTNYVVAGWCYIISALLDAIDGHAARAFNQSEWIKWYNWLSWVRRPCIIILSR